MRGIVPSPPSSLSHCTRARGSQPPKDHTSTVILGLPTNQKAPRPRHGRGVGVRVCIQILDYLCDSWHTYQPKSPSPAPRERGWGILCAFCHHLLPFVPHPSSFILSMVCLAYLPAAPEGCCMLRVSDDLRVLLQTQALVGSDWLPPTKIRALYLNDPAAIWLEHHGAAHGFAPETNSYAFLDFLAEKGHQFELRMAQA